MNVPKMTNPQINNWISKTKSGLLCENPYCGFCGKELRNGDIVDLAHLIRVGDEKKYKCDERNVVLAHRDCHDIYDNNTAGAIQLFMWDDIVKRIKEIDEGAYNRLMLKLDKNKLTE